MSKGKTGDVITASFCFQGYPCVVPSLKMCYAGKFPIETSLYILYNE